MGTTITLELDRELTGNTLVEILDGLTPEDRKEMVKQVIQSFVGDLNEERLDITAAHQEAIEKIKKQDYSYRHKTDEEIEQMPRYKKLVNERKPQHEIYVRVVDTIQKNITTQIAAVVNKQMEEQEDLVEFKHRLVKEMSAFWCEKIPELVQQNLTSTLAIGVMNSFSHDSGFADQLLRNMSNTMASELKSRLQNAY